LEAKSIAIKTRLLAKPKVWGDFDALTTALENLVSNAINYSPAESRVEVVLDNGPGDKEASISVTDQGIGIKPADQERVFERFYRTDQARSRGTGGTGLGLAIVRNTVAALGGRVELSSTPGVGSTFTLRLPQLHGKE
jgi:two-component system sensor histidine kinase SenX3